MPWSSPGRSPGARCARRRCWIMHCGGSCANPIHNAAVIHAAASHPTIPGLPDLFSLCGDVVAVPLLGVAGRSWNHNELEPMKPRHLLAVTVLLAACARDVTTPGNSTAPNAATAVALGAQFSCALTKAGKAYCWGDNLSGELGDSSFTSKLVPVATAGGHTFVAIVAGVETACALTQSGAPWCWGSDPTQAGAKLYSNTPKAVPGAPGLASITVGFKFACGLDRDGVAYCWGENEHGQLGVGDSIAHPSATRVSGSHRFMSISAGFWHACALATDGVPYCWGDNSFAQLGTTDTHSAALPTAVTGVNFTSMISGSIHVCGLTSAGVALCWGSNDSGQLGDGTITQRRTAVAVLGGLTFTSLYTGRANSIFAA